MCIRDSHLPTLVSQICTIGASEEYLEKAKAIGAKGIQFYGLCCSGLSSMYRYEHVIPLLSLIHISCISMDFPRGSGHQPPLSYALLQGVAAIYLRSSISRALRLHACPHPLRADDHGIPHRGGFIPSGRCHPRYRPHDRTCGYRLFMDGLCEDVYKRQLQALHCSHKMQFQ